ncbi:NAD(P)/FAD-dependent oxidoreductase [Amycolatopsis sp. YIM 10]|uniref:FAD/NAD(P)-dependent oxidoreductase n=1 Tax=Amycolatopsis sp. YIM 10 TaxID=2653857 RepID=UPI00129039E3|nr:NAD(P)/FAD-dependent oxidoreductase [Amycolatopsis sp. YIM 10]QFU89330.1 Hydrogen cyanide synthase subunit HcnB [Amycolatopsis sp. YIM 10]
MTRVVIVGAGPAGLAAADAALRAGAGVSLLDAAEQPGGQYHRMLPAAFRAELPDKIQHGRRAFDRRRRRVLDHPRCTWLPETSVWSLELRDGEPPLVHALRGVADGADRESVTLVPDALVLATGAHDRVLPFPGWTLPGVFTAGAAQALAKGERLAVGENVVVSGTGPFLLPVAASLSQVDARVLAVFEANQPRTVLRGWTRDAGELVPHLKKAGELAGYAAGQLRQRVPYRMGRAVVEARGDGRVEEVVVARLRADWSIIPGTGRTLAADAVCVGHGFTAQLELPVAAGCDLAGDAVLVDAGQRTSRPGVFAAGEITGIAGAPSAVDSGTVAGWLAAGGDPARITGALRRRDRGRAFGRRLARAHPIGGGWTGWLRPDTVICRCEAVDHACLNRALAAPVTAGARSVKLATRAGLGPCQGRICGPAVAELSAAAGAEVARPHHRPIAQPIRLGELANLRTEENP